MPMTHETQQMMKAVEIAAPGGPEVLRPARRPLPLLNDGDVLIHVHAAGVNRPDLLQRQGKYPPPPGTTDIPGLEVAGEIVRSTSAAWRPGDRVCALLAGGGYAEYAAVPAGQCLPVPQGLDMVAAAALPETFFTVWNNLFVRGGLKPGETVLIHGGASGIGTTAIQMAKSFGATVITTAGSDGKCASCRALGADIAINYRNEDFRAAIEAAYGRDSVHVVLDMVGGDYVGRNLALMAPEGRHVSIAHLNGATAEISVRDIMLKRLTLTGSTLRARPVAEKAMLAAELRREVWPRIEAGACRPVIFRTFPLEDAPEAHRALEQGDHFGKIVLTVG